MSKPVKNLVFMLLTSISILAYSLYRDSATLIVMSVVLTVITLGLLLNEYLLRKGLKVGMSFYDGEVKHVVEYRAEKQLIIANYVIELQSIDDKGLALYKVVENLNVGAKNKPSSKDVRGKWLAFNIYTRLVRLPNGRILDEAKPTKKK